MPNVSITQLQAMKNAGEKFAVLTAYDSTFAKTIGDAGVEVILVGDTLGMLVQGHGSTLPVSVDEMGYHIGCVARGNSRCLIIGDLPFGSYALPAQALDSAADLMRAGAHVVKLEGGEWLLETISMLTERGIPVCAHLGLTPQSVNAFGGYKVQGRQPEQARKIMEDAKAVEAAGASLLVLECVPHVLAREITEALTIPTIGIGAGAGTDAQVLVLHDMLGMNNRPPKFVRNFMAGAGSIGEAFASYARAVKDGSFPAPEHCYE